MCSRDSQRTVLGRERRGWQRGAVADQIEILNAALHHVSPDLDEDEGEVLKSSALLCSAAPSPARDPVHRPRRVEILSAAMQRCTHITLT